jgi:hypothetical protein
VTYSCGGSSALPLNFMGKGQEIYISGVVSTFRQRGDPDNSPCWGEQSGQGEGSNIGLKSLCVRWA